MIINKQIHKLKMKESENWSASKSYVQNDLKLNRISEKDRYVRDSISELRNKLANNFSNMSEKKNTKNVQPIYRCEQCLTYQKQIQCLKASHENIVRELQRELQSLRQNSSNYEPKINLFNLKSPGSRSSSHSNGGSFFKSSSYHKELRKEEKTQNKKQMQNSLLKKIKDKQLSILGDSQKQPIQNFQQKSPEMMRSYREKIQAYKAKNHIKIKFDFLKRQLPGKSVQMEIFIGQLINRLEDKEQEFDSYRSETDKQLQYLSKQIDILKKENSSLKEALTKNRTSQPKEKRSITQEEQNSLLDLKRENQRLSSLVRMMESQTSNALLLTKAQKKSFALEDELKNEKKKNEDRIKKLREQISQIKNEKAQLTQEQHHQKDSKIRELSQHNSSLIAQISEIRESANHLKLQKDTLEAHLENMKKKVIFLEIQKKNAESLNENKVNQKDTLNRDLKIKLTNQQATIAALKKREKQLIDEIYQEKRQRQNEKVKFNGINEKYKNSEQNLVRLRDHYTGHEKAKIENLQQIISQLKKDMMNQKQQQRISMSKLEKQHNNRQIFLQELISKQEGKISELQKQNDFIKHEKQQLKVKNTEKQHQITELKKQISMKQEGVMILKKENFMNEEKTSQAEKKILQMQKIIESKTIEMEEMKISERKFQETNQISQREDHRQIQISKVQEVNSQFNRLEEKCIQLNHEIESLQQTLSDQDNEIAERQQERALMLSDIELFQRDLMSKDQLLMQQDKEISDLKQTLAQKQTDTDRFVAIANEFKSKAEELKNQNEKLQRESSAKKREVENKESEIMTLKDEIMNKQKEILSIKTQVSRIEELKIEISFLKQQLQEKIEDLSKQCKENMALNQNIETCKNNLRNLDALKEELESINSEKNILQSRLSDMEIKITQQQEQLAKRENQRETMLLDINLFKTEIENRDGHLQQLNKTVMLLKQTQDKKQKDTDRFVAIANQYKAKMQELNQQIKKLENQNNILQKQNSEKFAKIVSLEKQKVEGKISKQAQDISYKMTEENEALKLEISRLKEHINILEKQKIEMVQLEDRKQKEFLLQEQEIKKQFKNEIKELREKQLGMNQLLQEIQKQNRNLSNDISIYLSKSSQFEKQISRKQSQVFRKELEIANLSKNLTETEQNLSRMNKDCEKYKLEISEQQKKIAEAIFNQNKIDEQKLAISILEKQVIDLKDLKVQYEKLKNELKIKHIQEEKCIQLNHEIESLQQTLSNRDNEIAERQQERALMLSDIELFQQDLMSKDQLLMQQDKEISDLKQTLAQKQTDTDRFVAIANEFKSKAEELKNQNEKLQRESSAKKREVENKESEIMTLKDEIMNKQQEIKKKEQEISMLQEKNFSEGLSKEAIDQKIENNLPSLNLNKTSEEFDNLMKEKDGIISNLKQQMLAKQAILEQKIKQIEHLHKQKLVIQRKNDEISQQNINLIGIKNSFSRAISKSKEKEEELVEEIQNFQKQLNKLKKDCQYITAELKLKQTTNKMLIQQMGEIKEKNGELIEKNCEYKTMINNVERTLLKRAEGQEKLIQEDHQMNNLLAKLKVVVDDRQKIKSEVNSELERMKNLNEKLEEKIAFSYEQYTQEIAAMKQKIQQREIEFSKQKQKNESQILKLEEQKKNLQNQLLIAAIDSEEKNNKSFSESKSVQLSYQRLIDKKQQQIQIKSKIIQETQFSQKQLQLTLQQKIEELQLKKQQIKKLEKNIQSKQIQIGHISAQIKLENKREEELMGQIQKLEKQKNEEEEIRKQQAQQIEMLNKQIQSLEENDKKIINILLQKDKQIVSLANQLNQANSPSKSESQKNILKDNIVELTLDIGKLQEKIGNLSEQKLHSDNNLKKIESKIEKKDKEISELSKKLENERIIKEIQMEEMLKKVNSYQDQIKNSQNQKRGIKDQLKEINKKVIQLEKDKQVQQQKNEELERKKAEIYERLLAQQKISNNLKVAHQKQCQELNELIVFHKSTAKNLEENCLAKQKQIQMMRQKNVTLDQQIKKNQEQIQKLLKNESEIASQLNALKENNRNFKEDKQRIQEEQEKQNRYKKQLEQKIRSLQKVHKQLEKQLSNSLETATSQQNLLNNQNKQLQQILEENVHKDAMISAMKKDIDSLNIIIKEKQKLMQQQEKDKQKFDEELKVTMRQIQQLENTVNQKEQKIKVIEQKVISQTQMTIPKSEIYSPEKLQSSNNTLLDKGNEDHNNEETQFQKNDDLTPLMEIPELINLRHQNARLKLQIEQKGSLINQLKQKNEKLIKAMNDCVKRQEQLKEEESPEIQNKFEQKEHHHNYAHRSAEKPPQNQEIYHQNKHQTTKKQERDLPLFGSPSKDSLCSPILSNQNSKEDIYHNDPALIEKLISLQKKLQEKQKIIELLDRKSEQMSFSQPQQNFKQKLGRDLGTEEKNNLQNVSLIQKVKTEQSQGQSEYMDTVSPYPYIQNIHPQTPIESPFKLLNQYVPQFKQISREDFLDEITQIYLQYGQKNKKNLFKILKKFTEQLADQPQLQQLLISIQRLFKKVSECLHDEQMSLYKKITDEKKILDMDPNIMQSKIFETPEKFLEEFPSESIKKIEKPLDTYSNHSNFSHKMSILLAENISEAISGGEQEEDEGGSDILNSSNKSSHKQKINEKILPDFGRSNISEPLQRSTYSLMDKLQTQKKYAKALKNAKLKSKLQRKFRR